MSQEMVAILNPKRKRKSRRRRSTAKRKGTVSRYRRNPTLATVSNPKRRRRRKTTAKRRRRSYRRNPDIKLGFDSILFTAGGAIGSKLIPTFLPVVKNYNKGIIGWGIQGGVGLLAYFLLGMLKMKKQAKYVLLGTGVNVITTALDDVLFKRMSVVQGLGFYPNRQLNSYIIDGEEYQLVEGTEGLGDYEMIPLDQSLGATAAKLAPARTVTSVMPAAAAYQPAVACGRMNARW